MWELRTHVELSGEGRVLTGRDILTRVGIVFTYLATANRCSEGQGKGARMRLRLRSVLDRAADVRGFCTSGMREGRSRAIGAKEGFRAGSCCSSMASICWDPQQADPHCAEGS